MAEDGVVDEGAVAASAAARASEAATRFISRVWCWSPKSASAMLVAPKVLVSTMSQPACKNNSWIF